MAEIKVQGSPSLYTFRVSVSGGMSKPENKDFAFDLKEIPDGATITSAKFTATQIRKYGRLRYTRSYDPFAYDPFTYDFTDIVTESLGTSGKTASIKITFDTDSGTADGHYKLSVSDVALEITYEGGSPAEIPVSEAVLDVSKMTFGGQVNVTINPGSDVVRHNVVYQLGTGTSQRTATHELTNGDSDDVFTLPDEWMDAMPYAVTADMSVVVTTLVTDANDADVIIGSKAYTVTVTVPDNVKPTAGTLAASAVNTGRMSQASGYYSGATRCQLTLTGAVAGAGSVIQSVTYSGWGGSLVLTEDPMTSPLTDPVQGTGTVTLEAVVKDGRGRTARTTKTIQVKTYTLPMFTSITFDRCNQNGEPSDNGDSVKITANYTYDTTQSGNQASASVAFRLGKNGIFYSEHTLPNGQQIILTPTSPQLQADYWYTMRFTVADNISSAEVYAELASSIFALHMLNGGKSVGIGQPADAPTGVELGRFTVNSAWDVYLGTKIHIGDQTLAEYIQSIIAGQT